ncbi:hypothetical protein GobsT_71940 [Gemmata obscuriglobus]|uniref:Uncharacterized protein n=1 Tax=Gemmata obscuriglobus TaxID=114 RepID=A0A2Z3HBF2_9BACT|nr:hypothetical protein [Gemmata obscuriglobus]AWM41712.1 hypothetical protein C1280_35105 [Gemmata obscuriglobus]QEG32339.1 hypothetical protein GobsT_71940 [Gemmata obscuriglobus]VTS11695.1 unnamed protein product [Gemmata obscuriglobus UQM 2246]
MTLLLVFVLLTGGLSALFLGVSIVAQGYLYQEAASRLPVRAAVGGLLLGGFITFWSALDKSNPGRYDTFFNFAPYSTAEFTEFEAVRWPAVAGVLRTDASGKTVEEVVKFKRAPGGTQFLREGTGEPFIMNGSDNSGSFMTGAIRLKGPEDPAPVRYNAIVKETAGGKSKSYTPERRFNEENGSRYVEAVQMGTLFVPSNKTVFLALLLNFVLLVLWLAVTWPVLRYSLAHALGLTAVGTLVTMLVLMPLLFRFNRPAAKPAPAPAPATTSVPVVTGAPKIAS